MAQAVPLDPPQAAIVITGTALPEARAERAYDVQRISRRDIEQSPSHELDQLLKAVPGVQLFRRSDSRSAHPTSQGVTLRALGGNASSRALLILDGVPQTDPFGGWVNWPAYDPQDLAGIRVVRGGGSVANGPGSLAGTIELVSSGDRLASADIELGSRSSAEARGRAGAAIGPGNLTVSARGARGAGFIPVTSATRGPADEAAGYRQLSGRARWLSPLGEATEVQANLSGFNDWRARGTDFTANRTNGADASLRFVGRGRWQWSVLGYWQWRNLRSSFASVAAGRVQANRASLQYSVPSHGIGGSVELRPRVGEAVELRLGGDARRTTGESRELFSYVAGQPTRRRAAGGESWTAGAFAEVSAALGNATLTGGARFDHWRVSGGHLFEQVIASGAVLNDVHYPTRSGWLPTGRAGLNMPIRGGFDLRSAAYLGWRMPTLNELFRPFRAGADATAANAMLEPERLAGVEAGFDVDRGPVRISLTAFVNRLNAAIANVTLGTGPGLFPGVGFVGPNGRYSQRQNVRAVNVRGVEASAEWREGPWSLRGGASLTHARMKGREAAALLDGLRPAQTPRFSGTLAASWEDGAKGAELMVRRVGAQFDDDLNEDSLKGATTLDAFVSWPLTRHLQLIGRGENLTDALVIAGINGDRSIERATPRTLWIGLRLR